MAFHPDHARLGELRRALRTCVGRACAYQLRDGSGAAIAGVLERVIRAERVPDATMADALAFGPAPVSAPAKSAAGPMIVPGPGPGQAIGLVSVRGIALYDVEYQPYAFSTRLLAATVTNLANDPEVGTIVLDISSPGGAVTGTAEAGDAIFAARERKKVVTIVNPLAASAAYWIASQASQIIAIPSADVGSIGVFMMHADCSGLMEQVGVKPTFIFAGEHKIEGNPYEPLADEARANWQEEVDTIYSEFLKAVARGRGVSVDEVREKFGKGRTLMAPAAKKVGMIDAIAPADHAFAHLGVTGRSTNARRSIEAQGPREDLGSVLGRALAKSRRERLDQLAQEPRTLGEATLPRTDHPLPGLRHPDSASS